MLPVSVSGKKSVPAALDQVSELVDGSGHPYATVDETSSSDSTRVLDSFSPTRSLIVVAEFLHFL